MIHRGVISTMERSSRLFLIENYKGAPKMAEAPHCNFIPVAEHRNMTTLVAKKLCDCGVCKADDEQMK